MRESGREGRREGKKEGGKMGGKEGERERRREGKRKEIRRSGTSEEGDTVQLPPTPTATNNNVASSYKQLYVYACG